MRLWVVDETSGGGLRGYRIVGGDGTIRKLESQGRWNTGQR